MVYLQNIKGDDIVKNTVDYIDLMIKNQEKFNYEIIHIDDFPDGSATIKCLECGAIKTALIKSYYKNNIKLNRPMHNQFCSNYYMNMAKTEIGISEAKKFHDLYRYSHERTHNKNSKDYDRYSGKFGFKDYAHYHITCFNIYKESLLIYNYKELSIDRIDNSKGYEPNNVRFVDMKENLRNRDVVRPVIGTNIVTGEEVIGVSMPDFIHKIQKGSVSGAFTSIKNNRIYLKEWKIRIA